MTEATELALESICGGILFCLAVTMLLTFQQRIRENRSVLLQQSEHVIFYEVDSEWKHLED